VAATRAFFAPGRVNLIGEHTDYSGGLVLPVAVELGVTVEGAPAKRIELDSEWADGRFERYVTAVAAELDALGRPPVGFAGTVRSTLPVGAGLSSSAALEVAVALALCSAAGFEPAPLELALACQRAELRAVGVPCGILDQAASVLGRAGHAILIDTGTLEHEAIPLPRGLALLVVDSGVRRRLAESGYAERRRELEAGHPSRVRHVEAENRRVALVAEILREPGQPRLAELGGIFRAGHESLRDDFEVSTPELDRLVELAYAAGALSARMTGGGFGGSIVALVDEARAAEVAAAVVAGYAGEATARVCHASDGAGELTS
jgi:galactokinase